MRFNADSFQFNQSLFFLLFNFLIKIELNRFVFWIIDMS